MKSNQYGNTCVDTVILQSCPMAQVTSKKFDVDKKYLNKYCTNSSICIVQNCHKTTKNFCFQCYHFYFVALTTNLR